MKRKLGRETIIATAAKLFYRQGYSNTGINQIIAESGVSKSSMYHIFRSKEDLLIAYLEQTGATTINALRTAADKHDMPHDRLVAIFDYIIDLVDQKDFYGCHFLNMVYEMPQDAVRIREQIKKQKNNVRALFAEILAPAGKEDIADQLYTLFEGALISNKVYDDVWPVIAARNLTENLVKFLYI